MSIDRLTDSERYEYFLFKLIDEDNIIAFSALLATYIEGKNDPLQLRLPIPQEEAKNVLEQFVEERAIHLPYNLLQYSAYSRKFGFVKLLHEKFGFPLDEDLSLGESASETELLKLAYGFAYNLEAEAIEWFCDKGYDFRLPLEAQAQGAYSPLHAALFSYASILQL